MRQIKRNHIINSIAEGFIAHYREGNNCEYDANYYISHQGLKLLRLFHTGVNIEYDAIAFEIEDGDAEEEGQGVWVQIAEVCVQLGLVDVLMPTVEHYGRQCKYDRYVGEKRDVRDECECLQPADWDENQHAEGYVSCHIITKILPRLYAYDLVHLVTDEKQIRNAEANL